MSDNDPICSPITPVEMGGVPAQVRPPENDAIAPVNMMSPDGKPARSVEKKENETVFDCAVRIWMNDGKMRIKYPTPWEISADGRSYYQWFIDVGARENGFPNFDAYLLAKAFKADMRRAVS